MAHIWKTPDPVVGTGSGVPEFVSAASVDKPDTTTAHPFKSIGSEAEAIAQRLAPRRAAAQAPLNLEALADLRRQRDLFKVHALGPRVLGEMLDVLGRRYSIGTGIDQLLAEYAKLSPEALAAAGGDRFPPMAFTVLAGGRNTP